MKRPKKTVDLDRFAAEARDESREAVPLLHTSHDDRLQKLLNNIGKTVIVPTDLLIIHDNIRQILDVSSPEFRKLAESIRKHGVKQNLIGDLRVGENGDWKVICVAGQRRLLAAIEVGQSKVPVRLEQYADESSFLVDSLSENILRQNLHTLDAALGYLRLLTLGWSPDGIAEAFERKRDTVMKMLRLARYPQSAHEIIRLYPEKFTSAVLFAKFVSKSWADDQALISALEEFALLERKRPLRATITDHEVKEWESRFADRGVRATSKGSKESGQITVIWRSVEEFNEIESIFSGWQGNQLPSPGAQQSDPTSPSIAKLDDVESDRLLSSSQDPHDRQGNRLPSVNETEGNEPMANVPVASQINQSPTLDPEPNDDQGNQLPSPEVQYGDLRDGRG
jgi:ParB/RepB/Spo0J family partition protein